MCLIYQPIGIKHLQIFWNIEKSESFFPKSMFLETLELEWPFLVSEMHLGNYSVGLWSICCLGFNNKTKLAMLYGNTELLNHFFQEDLFLSMLVARIY